MNIPTIQSTSLYFREGNSDKEYHLAIEPKGEGYLVTFAYGRRGSTLTSGRKTRPDRANHARCPGAKVGETRLIPELP